MSSAYSVLIPAGSPTPAFVFDLDGTLIDSVYQHVLAWREALEGIELSSGGAAARTLRAAAVAGGRAVQMPLRAVAGAFRSDPRRGNARSPVRELARAGRRSFRCAGEFSTPRVCFCSRPTG
jgi:phosphoglycolate phosphatase-like HAD superfamily hydrolase